MIRLLAPNNEKMNLYSPKQSYKKCKTMHRYLIKSKIFVKSPKDFLFMRNDDHTLRDFFRERLLPKLGLEYYIADSYDDHPCGECKNSDGGVTIHYHRIKGDPNSYGIYIIKGGSISFQMNMRTSEIFMILTTKKKLDTKNIEKATNESIFYEVGFDVESEDCVETMCFEFDRD